ncbi:hypothetical protein [Pseudoalteromonas rhizosphaerae]|uniref:Uncharacterized protein n=1 Tax=Pseudoalteromonas rhizosphaerae TaxID=2518973 RepID=A0ABW8KZH1_9GAMM
MHFVNLETKPFLAMAKIKITTIYINYIADLLSVLALFFVIFGSVLILTDKKASTSVLSNFGSFIGGMFTFIAVVYSLKEFLINKRRNGSNEYLSLINELFETMQTINKTLWKLTGYVKRPPLLNSPDEKQLERNKIKGLGKVLTKIKFNILTKYGSIYFLNEELGLRMLEDIKTIETNIDVVTDSIDSICMFVTSKDHDSNLLDEENAFIKDISTNESFVYFTENHLKILQALGHLMKLKAL